MNNQDKIKFEDGKQALEEFFNDESVAKEVLRITKLAADIPYDDIQRQCITFCREVYSDLKDLLRKLDLRDTFSLNVVIINDVIDEDGNASDFSHAVVVIENPKTKKGIMIEPQDTEVQVLRYDIDPDDENVESLIKNYINEVFEQRVKKFRMSFGDLERVPYIAHEDDTKN